MAQGVFSYRYRDNPPIWLFYQALPQILAVSSDAASVTYQMV